MVKGSKKGKKHAKIISHPKREKKSSWGWLPIVILILAIAIVGYISDWTYFVPETEDPGVILVNVNNEPIYQSELDTQWNALSVQSKMQITRSELLEQLVQEKLLLQKAKSENIVVTDKEVDEYISFQLLSTGMTENQLEEMLKAQGTSLEDLKIIYKKQLTLAKLFDETVNQSIDPTIEEVEAYYADNKDQFYAPEQVRVRHILIPINEEFNETRALEMVDEVTEQLDEENNENFCDLVTNYTSDLGSRDLCGEYTFPKGTMVEEFENASFDMEIGERRIVKSMFGYHIILKTDSLEEGYLALEERLSDYPGEPTVRDIITQQLTQEKARGVFDDYIQELMEGSNIEYYEDISLAETAEMADENESLDEAEI